MAEALWDVVYLDADRARALAVELLKGDRVGDRGEAVPGGGSRLELTGVLRTLLRSLDAGGKVTAIDSSFDYAGWTAGGFRDGQMLRVSTDGGGRVRLLDYPWLSSVMETLPRMLKVTQRAELSGLKQKRDAHQITQQEVEQRVKEHQSQLKDLENWKMDELTDVVRELFGHSVRLKIVPGGATRGEMLVAACPPGGFLEPPALLSQRYGCDIDAPMQVLGMINAPPAGGAAASNLMPTGNAVEDMFERLALAVNRIHRVASAPDFPAFSLTPLAIWREL